MYANPYGEYKIHLFDQAGSRHGQRAVMAYTNNKGSRVDRRETSSERTVWRPRARSALFVIQ